MYVGVLSVSLLDCLVLPARHAGMAIRDAFLPPDFSRSRATSAATSVQCSLYQRLRKSHADRAGALGWLLVRLGQPEHREHDEALETIMTRTPAELAALSSVVGAARAAAKGAGASEICDAILEVMASAQASASLQAKARGER